jgi:hypothetical protein
MQISIYQQIETLLHLDKYSEEYIPASTTHWKIIALDFDQTLATATTYLGSEDWYKFLTDTCKKTEELHYDAHYKWSIKVREVTPYRACEDSTELTNLIEKLRKNNWLVVILTTRKPDMETITLQHIQQAQLPFVKEDIIFKPRSGIQKNQAFQEWIQKRPGWEKVTRVTVKFVDDTVDHCKSMASLDKLIENVQVECLHYCKYPSTANINQSQLEALAIQLACYKSKKFSSFLNKKEELGLEEALNILNIQFLAKEALFAEMKQLAEEEGTSFMTKDEYQKAKSMGLI